MHGCRDAAGLPLFLPIKKTTLLKLADHTKAFMIVGAPTPKLPRLQKHEMPVVESDEVADAYIEHSAIVQNANDDQFEYGVITLRNKMLRHFFYSADDLKSIGRPMSHEGIDLVDIGGTPYLGKRFFIQ